MGERWNVREALTTRCHRSYMGACVCVCTPAMHVCLLGLVCWCFIVWQSQRNYTKFCCATKRRRWTRKIKCRQLEKSQKYIQIRDGCEAEKSEWIRLSTWPRKWHQDKMLIRLALGPQRTAAKWEQLNFGEKEKQNKKNARLMNDLVIIANDYLTYRIRNLSNHLRIIHWPRTQSQHSLRSTNVAFVRRCSQNQLFPNCFFYFFFLS